jgi:hypothetical protein
MIWIILIIDNWNINSCDGKETVIILNLEEINFLYLQEINYYLNVNKLF